MYVMNFIWRCLETSRNAGRSYNYAVSSDWSQKPQHVVSNFKQMLRNKLFISKVLRMIFPSSCIIWITCTSVRKVQPTNKDWLSWMMNLHALQNLHIFRLLYYLLSAEIRPTKSQCLPYWHNNSVHQSISPSLNALYAPTWHSDSSSNLYKYLSLIFFCLLLHQALSHRASTVWPWWR